MRKSAIRAVLFDLGNTLAAYYHVDEFAPLLERGIRNVLGELQRRGLAAPDFDAALNEARLLNAERKDLRVYPLAQRLARLFGVDAGGDGELLAAMSAQFLQPVFALGQRYQDVLPALAHLRAAGFRTGIVSNSPWGSPAALWRAELRRLELLDAVDATLFCGDVGWRKPAKVIFERAAEQAGVPPQQCCFVGDDLKWDIEGAAAAGMRAILLDRDGRHATHSAAKAADLWDVVRHLDGAREQDPA